MTRNPLFRRWLGALCILFCLAPVASWLPVHNMVSTDPIAIAQGLFSIACFSVWAPLFIWEMVLSRRDLREARDEQ
jgi:hypothetical protein